MHRNKLSLVFISFAVLFLFSSNWSQAQVKKNKTTTLSGRIHRSDTNQPISGAKLEIWSAQGNGLETKTDEKGNYSFAQVKAGKYKVRIHGRYNKISDSPCSISGSRVTADNNSNVTLKDEGIGYVDVWVSIDNFRITPGKPITKDFDVACKGTYRN